jgi:protein-tyrosine-phosphatase
VAKKPKNEKAAKSRAKRRGDAGERPLKGLLTRRMRESRAKRLLLFVSTGNTCRSPMAAAYLSKLLEERKSRHIEVRSAGVMTIPGLLATDESKLMLEPYGVSLDRHRSQPLTEELIRRADLILGMTPFHVQMALRMSDAARDKTFLFKEYTGTDPKGRPIPDPMGCTLEVYKRCFRQIKQACDALVTMEFVTGKTAKPKRPRRKTTKPKTARKKKTAVKAKSRSASKKRPASSRKKTASRTSRKKSSK